MIEPFRDPGGLPIRSLAGLNNLPVDQRDAVYYSLLPDELFAHFGLERGSAIADGAPSKFIVNGPPGAHSVDIRFYHQADARDPALYAQMADTANNQIVILLMVINDPDGPRFDVDRNQHGERTKFGTHTRHLEAEVAAMQAGLGPGQIRRGLKLSRHMLPRFEMFMARLGHDLYFLEPLAYHSAILFERYGFAYSQGRKKMEWIHQEFQTGGLLASQLDGSTPFRMPGAERTVRGRSWAIHDGLLGEPFTGVHMFKRLGVEAGVRTFPDAAW